MWFLAWLAGSFLVVAVINLYLRYFDLPRRPPTASLGSITADGRVSLTSSSSSSFGGPLSQYSFGGAAVSSQHCAASPAIGETANWINHILSWLYQQTSVGSGQKVELLEVWFRSLTQQAQYETGNFKVKFDSVHGSLPEFSNFSANPPSAVSSAISHGHTTGVPSNYELTVNMTVVAKDITLQISISTPNSDTSRLLFADVYLIHLQGQLKLVVSKTSANGETPVQLSFVTVPELRLQILPSGRLDASIDLNTIEKAVRTALCQAVVDVTWSTTGGFRDSHASTPGPIRMDSTQSSYNTSPMKSSLIGGQMTNQQAVFGGCGGNISPQVSQNYSDPHQPSMNYQDQNQLHHHQQQQQQQPLSNSSLTQYSQQPVSSLQQQQQQQQFQSQQSQQMQQQQNLQPFIQEQTFSSRQQLQQQMAPLPTGVSRTGDTMFNNGVTHRLLIKIIKANGLADDLGSCNAYCAVSVDHPSSQNFMTCVVPNTVNPMWDEQFVFDIDNLSRQIQLDVLDRDKPIDSELLGRAVVHLDEIRRMPSSRQILPLTGRSRSRKSTTGSVTVEFMLVDAGETLRMPINDSGNSMRLTTQQQTMMQSPEAGNISPSGSYGTSYSDPLMKRNATGSNMTNAGEFSAYQNHRLSAHDLALTQQAGNKPQGSPTLVVTGSELQRDQKTNMQGTLDNRGRGHEPKESFASALKKRLIRAGGKKRSQSADRTQPSSNSHLRPPGDSAQGYRTTDALDGFNGDPKTRSNSFTSSLRRIFKPTSPGIGDVGAGRRDVSRENSLTKKQPSELNQQQQQHHLLQLQQQQVDYNNDRSVRQNTPVPPDRRTVDQFGRASSTDLSNQYSASPSGSTLNTPRGRY